jgi:hypothetical protein
MARPVKYPFHILNLDNGDTDNVLFFKDVRNRIDQLIEFLSPTACQVLCPSWFILSIASEIPSRSF